MKHIILSIAVLALVGCGESPVEPEPEWQAPSTEGSNWSPVSAEQRAEDAGKPKAYRLTPSGQHVKVYRFTDPKTNCEYLIFETVRGVDSQKRDC